MNGSSEWRMGNGEKENTSSVSHSLLPIPHLRSENHLPLIEVAFDDDRFVGLDFAAE
jgi:hypothetical protein